MEEMRVEGDSSPNLPVKDAEVSETGLTHLGVICGGPSRTRTGDLWLVKPTS